MIGRLHTVVIDCRDPEALAGFYAELLGLPVTVREDDWVTLGGDGWPRLGFQRAPEHRAPDWPDPGRPQQFHLDVLVEDIDGAERLALALGATPLPGGEPGVPGGELGFRIYADPAGHPFCLEFEAG